MARASGFFAGILGIVAGVIQIFIFMQVIEQLPPNDNISFYELVFYAIFSQSSQPFVGYMLMGSFITLILAFLILMVTKKKTIIFGSLFGVVASILNIIGWNLGSFFMNYIAAPIWAIATLLLFVGAIMMRKEGKLSIFSGFLLLGVTIAGQIVIFMISIAPIMFYQTNLFITWQDDYGFAQYENYYLILIMAQSFALGLHGIFIGFSRQKGKGGEDEEAEDTMSIDNQSAFTSYVEDKPKKQKKEKKKSEEVEFTF